MPLFSIVPADLLPMERHRLLLVQIPHHEAAEPFDLLGLQGLNPARIALEKSGNL